VIETLVMIVAGFMIGMVIVTVVPYLMNRAMRNRRPITDLRGEPIPETCKLCTMPLIPVEINSKSGGEPYILKYMRCPMYSIMEYKHSEHLIGGYKKSET
jgi:hypothetical protein